SSGTTSGNPRIGAEISETAMETLANVVELVVGVAE
ncbi:hypothetical protein Tco_0694691, partial [Tanacetum coccineum]